MSITLDRNRVSIKPLERKWVFDDNQPDPSSPSHRSSSHPETSSTLCREGQSVQSITSLSSAAASLNLKSELKPFELNGYHGHVAGNNYRIDCGLKDRLKNKLISIPLFKKIVLLNGISSYLRRWSVIFKCS
jgi:hypothetical protein